MLNRDVNFTIRKIGDYENIHSVYPLYLITHSTIGHFKTKDENKYLVLDSTEKYEEGCFGIRSEIKRINGGKERFYKNNYSKIKVDTEDDFSLNKPFKWPTLAINVRTVFEKNKKCILKFI